MKISIITAVYNGSATIADCIRSVNDQSYNNIEHIIIDGASKDSTLKIIKSMPNRVTKIISEPDDDIYDALNKGINLAKGDIIGILHADDVFAGTNIIENVMDRFQQINIDGVYGDLVLVSKYNLEKIIRKWSSQPFHNSLLYRGWMPAHPTLFLKKNVYEKHGLFDINFKISADYDYMLRIFKDKSLRFQYLSKVITKMRVGGASNGSINKIILKTKEDFFALKKNNIPNPLLALSIKKLSKILQYF